MWCFGVFTTSTDVLHCCQMLQKCYRCQQHEVRVAANHILGGLILCSGKRPWVLHDALHLHRQFLLLGGERGERPALAQHQRPCLRAGGRGHTLASDPQGVSSAEHKIQQITTIFKSGCLIAFFTGPTTGFDWELRNSSFRVIIMILRWQTTVGLSRVNVVVIHLYSAKTLLSLLPCSPS